MEKEQNRQPHLTLRFLRLRPEVDSDIPLPRYMTEGSAGMDIYAAPKDAVTIPPGQIALVPTGFAVAVPAGFEAQIRPRSGLACKHGIGIVNSPGTIDSDYRGEVKIALINYSKLPYTVKRKDRIAQMIITPVVRTLPLEVKELDKTDRGEGGFGHTGKH